MIQFHFLDYKVQNYYNEIEVKGINKIINYNTINIVIENIRIPNYEYYPISIKLISTKEKKNAETISFKFNLIHGFLNKINAFINQKFSKPYFYEYLYYSFNEIFFQTNKTIKINDTKKIINICDNFESSNRIRFNILNIPIQNKYLNEFQNSNSIMECEVFIEKNTTTVGIFDINEIENNIPKLISNEVFDIYYEDFGFIYNFLSNFDNIKDEDIKNKKKEDFIKTCKNNFKKFETNNNVDFLHIINYENNITKSQMKTRIGILVSYYLNDSNEETINDYFKDIIWIFSQVKDIKEYITDLQFFRLFKYLIRRKIKFYQFYKICIISKLKEKSPYLKAYKFNIDEISNIKENSRLFMGYLQLDSYILNNYLLPKNDKSHSLSIEPLFFVKNHLKSTYEEFFLIESTNEAHYAQSITDEKITVINIAKIFENSNLEINKLDIINNEKFLNNHAFAVSMELRHENNCHHKKNQKNSRINSPIYYIDKTNIKTVKYLKNKTIQGEDGRFIEAFIDENREVINDLQTYIIYGELLDYNLFIQENFNELKEKKKKIDNNKNKFGYLINESEKDNQQDLNENSSEKKFEENYQFLKKYGTLMISDEEYDTFLLKQIIQTAKKNNSYNQLPRLILYIDQRMKEEKE